MAEVLFARDAQLQRFQNLLNRNGGAEFGYHGLAGIGKTSLLDAFEDLARRTTPYVVRFDFTRGDARSAKTPTAALLATILAIEATNQAARKPSLLMRILRRQPRSPFIPALEALGCRTDRRQQLVNVIWAFQSQVVGNAQTISGGQQPGDNSGAGIECPPLALALSDAGSLADEVDNRVARLCGCFSLMLGHIAHHSGHDACSQRPCERG